MIIKIGNKETELTRQDWVGRTLQGAIGHPLRETGVKKNSERKPVADLLRHKMVSASVFSL
jgi:hypothetical protein